MITEKHLTVPRNLRYYTYGNLNESTVSIWILLHGHGQLAGDFIKLFYGLSEFNSYLIAPEGLMRFYLKGSYGDVGASWMTKEDRLTDISDYINYLDSLYENELSSYIRKQAIKVNALGFSQGATTLSRWMYYGKSRIDRAVFWCGEIATDIDLTTHSNFACSEIYQVFGDADKIFSEDFPLRQKMILENAGLKPKMLVFRGGHEVNAVLMKKLGII